MTTKKTLNKVADKKVAVKKVVVKKATVKKVACGSCSKLTRIVAKVDAGWGNNLYIRGEGAGLSWHKGVLMQCVDCDEWLWEKKVTKGTVAFKLLLNDKVWSQGEDYIVSAGETFTCHPRF